MFKAAKDKIRTIFTRLIAQTEDLGRPFIYYLIFFLASFSLRNFLEFFDNKADIDFRLLTAHTAEYGDNWLGLATSAAHYLLFWFALFISLAVILYLATKENIAKIFRVLSSFSILIILTPLLDLIFSAGKGIPLNYVPSFSLKEIFPFPKIITLGMSVTISLGIILTFIYVIVKSNSLKKGIFAVVSFYILLLLASLAPVIINSSEALLICRGLLIYIIFIAALLFGLVNFKAFKIFACDIRWPRAGYYIAMFLFGILLSGKPLTIAIQPEITSFILTVLAILFAWIAAVVFNNLEDISIDLVSNPERPIPSNQVSPLIYRRVGFLFIILSLSCGLAVNFQSFLFMGLMIGNSFLYSAPPLRLKRIPIFSKIFISFNSLIIVMLGFLFAGKELLDFPQTITWLFLICVTFSGNFIDLKDFAGDRIGGIKTLPGMIGLRPAKILLGISFILTYFLLGLALLDLKIAFAGLFLGLIQFFLLNRKNYKDSPVITLQLAAIVLLIIYLDYKLRAGI